ADEDKQICAECGCLIDGTSVVIDPFPALFGSRSREKTSSAKARNLHAGIVNNPRRPIRIGLDLVSPCSEPLDSGPGACLHCFFKGSLLGRDLIKTQPTQARTFVSHVLSPVPKDMRSFAASRDPDW